MPPQRLLVAAALVAVTACSSGSTHSSSATTAPARSSSSTSTTAAPATTTLSATQAPWSLPARLSREAALVDHGQLVVAGGLTTGDKTVGTVYRIDPSSGAATALPALPSPVHDTAGVYAQGRALVIGGGAATESDAVQAVGSSPSVVGHLPGPRADLAAVATGDDVYVVGGYDGHAALGEVLRATDGTHFTAFGHLAIAVRYPAIAVLGDTLWVFGGELPSGADTDAIQAIDLRSGTTTVAGHLTATLGHASAFVLHDTVWVVGGRAGGAPSANIRRFDPATRSVTVAGKLPIPVRDSAVAVIGSTAYLLGGQAPTPINDVVLLR